MKKQYLINLALIILVLGIGLVAYAVLIQQALNADAAVFIPGRDETVQSFLIFGGTMIVSAIIFFAILAYL